MRKPICYFVLLLLTLTISLQANEKLVTIHGIFGSAWNLKYLASPLEGEGMDVTYWGYPSRDKVITEHAEDLVLELQTIAQQNPGQPINFLTHSMGGLILRAAVNLPDCPPEALIGKAVLVAPPNQGAVWGRMVGELDIANKLGKDKAGKELMTEQDFEHLGQFPDSMQVMVIAGNFSLNFLIPGENDGTVAVSETYLNTPHRHEVVKAGHKGILISSEAAALIHSFFQ